MVETDVDTGAVPMPVPVLEVSNGVAEFPENSSAPSVLVPVLLDHVDSTEVAPPVAWTAHAV